MHSPSPSPQSATEISAVADATNTRESRTSCVFRLFTACALATVLTLLGGLLLLAAYPPPAEFLSELASPSPLRADVRLASGFIALYFVLGLTTLGFIARRFHFHSWKILGCGWLAVIPVLVYLAIDEAPLAPSLRIEEFGMTRPGDEQSFAALQRLRSRDPFPAGVSESRFINVRYRPADPAAWRSFLTANRADLERDWLALSSVRTWWTELNTFARIGDLSSARVDAEVLPLRLLRVYVQRALSIASLHALDGHGDAAFAELQSLLEVGRKLEAPSRSRTRSSTAIFVQLRTLETAGFVLATASVSPSFRSRFASALAAADTPSGARRIVAINFAVDVQDYTSGRLLAGDIITSGNTRWRWLRLPLNALSPILYNPQATKNLYDSLSLELQELAARRETAALDSRVTLFRQKEGRPRLKNLLGHMVHTRVLTSSSLAVDAFWRVTDLRLALLAQLSKN